MLPFLIWPIFFLLNKLRIPIITIENVVISVTIIYVLLYLVQFLNPSIILFSEGNVVGDNGFEERRGIVRVIFPGVGIFWLGIYMALVKATQGKNFWMMIFFLVLVLLGLLIPIMQVTRSYIVPTLIIYTYHFVKKINFSKMIILTFSIVVCTFLMFETISPAIEGMIRQSEETAQDGKKDMRYATSYFFLNEFSPSILNNLFGNGMGHSTAEYGRYLESLARSGFHISDIGIIGVYIYFGIPFVIGWILIFYKVIKASLPEKYNYIKYYFFNIFFALLVGSTFYHVNYAISTVFALYIFQKNLIFEKRKFNFLSKILKWRNSNSDLTKNVSPRNNLT
jgi:hypothetical protein